MMNILLWNEQMQLKLIWKQVTFYRMRTDPTCDSCFFKETWIALNSFAANGLGPNVSWNVGILRPLSFKWLVIG